MASSAAAMPGAMALTFTSPAAATAAKVIMTPTTVPSRPRNGPPEMQMVSSTISLSMICFSRTSPPSSAARIAWMERPERAPVLRSAAMPMPDFLGPDVIEAIDGGFAQRALPFLIDPAAEALEASRRPHCRARSGPWPSAATLS